MHVQPRKSRTSLRSTAQWRSQGLESSFPSNRGDHDNADLKFCAQQNPASVGRNLKDSRWHVPQLGRGVQRHWCRGYWKCTSWVKERTRVEREARRHLLDGFGQVRSDKPSPPIRASLCRIAVLWVGSVCLRLLTVINRECHEGKLCCPTIPYSRSDSFESGLTNQQLLNDTINGAMPIWNPCSHALTWPHSRCPRGFHAPLSSHGLCGCWRMGLQATEFTSAHYNIASPFYR